MKFQNKQLKQRLSFIQPEKAIQKENLAQDFRHHLDIKKTMLVTGNRRRKQPDILVEIPLNDAKNKSNQADDPYHFHFMKPLARPEQMSKNKSESHLTSKQRNSDEKGLKTSQNTASTPHIYPLTSRRVRYKKYTVTNYKHIYSSRRKSEKLTARTHKPNTASTESHAVKTEVISSSDVIDDKDKQTGIQTNRRPPPLDTAIIGHKYGTAVSAKKDGAQGDKTLQRRRPQSSSVYRKNSYPRKQRPQSSQHRQRVSQKQSINTTKNVDSTRLNLSRSQPIFRVSITTKRTFSESFRENVTSS